MEKNTEKNLKLADSQLKLSLETTQEFVDMWTKNYQSTLGKLAQVPAFGPVREKQEKMMKSVPLYSKLYTTWIDSNINLQNVLLDATIRTFENINFPKCAEDFKSYVNQEKYKNFYNIWMNTYSDMFKYFMRPGHYSSDMGKLSSVLSDFQEYNREIVEENYLKPNNIPTMTDIEEIHKESDDIMKIVKELIGDMERVNKIEHDRRVTLYNNLEKARKLELAKKEEMDKKIELSRQIELSKQEELSKQDELPKHKELHVETLTKMSDNLIKSEGIANRV
jgi:hypothetical protein